MIGLLFFAFLILWVLFCWWLTSKITRRNPSKSWRPAAKVGLFVMLLSLILIDEIVAMPYLSYLCSRSAVINFNEGEYSGRAVYLANTEIERAYGFTVPLIIQHWRYLDVNSRKPVISYKTLTVKGGFLVRMLGIFETDSPLILRRHCAPKGRFQIFDSLGIKRVDREIVLKGGKN